MRYLALAADYDGTLASDGIVRPDTIGAIERLVATGRKLILVTGRVLPELLEIFPHISLCERVVAENGAVLYRPATKEITLLAPAPSAGVSGRSAASRGAASQHRPFHCRHPRTL